MLSISTVLVRILRAHKCHESVYITTSCRVVELLIELLMMMWTDEDSHHEAKKHKLGVTTSLHLETCLCEVWDGVSAVNVHLDRRTVLIEKLSHMSNQEEDDIRASATRKKHRLCFDTCLLQIWEPMEAVKDFLSQLTNGLEQNQCSQYRDRS